MWRQKSGNIILTCILLLCAGSAWSQEVIRDVEIRKVSATQFRVRYQLSAAAGIDYSTVVLTILRKRSGDIEEIFSEEITPDHFDRTDKTFTYEWTTTSGQVKTGDELQARIKLAYQKETVAKKNSSGNNLPPLANAGTFMDLQLPLTAPVQLNGSQSRDIDGSIISYSWKQIAGPVTVSINHPDSAIALASGLTREGSYAFELTVKDRQGDTGSDRIIITVKPAVTMVAPIATSTPRKDSVLRKPVVVSHTVEKLKGGPSNALLNLLVPGLGHYYVSGDYHGKNRKSVAFVVTALYAASAGAGVYEMMKSDQQFSKYKQLAAFREYQHDASGNIIGVRGGNEEAANRYLASGKTAQKNARILLGAGAGIMAADFVYTLLKGMKNKAAWKKDQGQAMFFISTDGQQMMTGIRIKL